MIHYGNTVENNNLIRHKAESKSNGIYQFRGITYRVRDNSVTHIAVDDQILECAYGFNVVVGSYVYSMGGDNAIKALMVIQ